MKKKHLVLKEKYEIIVCAFLLYTIVIVGIILINARLG